MSCSQLAIRTLVEPSLRAAIDADLQSAFHREARALQVNRAYQGQETVATNIAQFADHAHSMSALFLEFPYSSIVLLVVQWSVIVDAVMATGSANPMTRIAECLAGWDGVLLVAQDLCDADLSTILTCRLAPRLSVLLVNECPGPRLRVELQRVASSAFVLPPARAPRNPQLFQTIEKLPVPWRTHVRDALRAPEVWNIKRLVQACGVDRRTLERQFRKVGLSTPAVLLGAPRASSEPLSTSRVCDTWERF